MAERRLRVHRRNLDGEVCRIIKAADNIASDKLMNEQMLEGTIYRTEDNRKAPRAEL
jgi:hypothetical protein